jgi:hypothetical protein
LKRTFLRKGVGQGAGGGRRASGVNAAARELNIPKTEAHHAVKIASVSPEAKEVQKVIGAIFATVVAIIAIVANSTP